MAEGKIEAIKELIEANAPTSYYIIFGIIFFVIFLFMMKKENGDEGYGDKMKEWMRLGFVKNK